MILRNGPLDRLERRFRRFAIPNLMLIIVGAMAIVFIMDFAIGNTTGRSLISILSFDRDAILSGQVWRVVTFLFVPPSTSILWVIFALYFYYMIGSTLENQWGAFGFTLYYIIGALGSIISGFIAGSVTNSYLNLSMFFAFALLYPDYQILLFFFIPIKMKYLALLDAISFIIMFILGGWSTRLAIIMALLNLFIFFGPNFIDRIKGLYRSYKWKQKFK
ncbi:MAG TPA: hypothetical protein H9681_04845 [Firmicutes bacterium]|nr:hypothetical protein [Bacillota bacterium]